MHRQWQLVMLGRGVVAEEGLEDLVREDGAEAVAVEYIRPLPEVSVNAVKDIRGLEECGRVRRNGTDERQTSAFNEEVKHRKLGAETEFELKTRNNDKEPEHGEMHGEARREEEGEG